MIDKEHIIAEIKRTAKENNDIPLGRGKFEKETGIKQYDWCGKYWCRWNEALIEAGYSPNQMKSAYSNDFLIEKIIEFTKDLGHFPTNRELRLKAHQEMNFPCDSTFSRFGKKHQLINTILEYCQGRDGYQDVIEICNNITKPILPDPPKIASSESQFGFVYLMKSGKYFKIGRSKCAERREFELKILLPEKLEMIHKIKTDDPVGIEKYWHDRFKEKRRNGEWFELSASDVKSFRIRKFM